MIKPSLKLLSIALAALVLFACAPGKKRPPRGSRPVPVQTGSEARTAERMASDSLVEQGRQALEEGRLEQAASLFEDAIQLEPDNGPAYYYAALVQARLDRPEEAQGFLDKAESLLGGKPEWTDRIAALTRQLGN